MNRSDDRPHRCTKRRLASIPLHTAVHRSEFAIAQAQHSALSSQYRRRLSAGPRTPPCPPLNLPLPEPAPPGPTPETSIAIVRSPGRNPQARGAGNGRQKTLARAEQTTLQRNLGNEAIPQSPPSRPRAPPRAGRAHPPHPLPSSWMTLPLPPG